MAQYFTDWNTGLPKLLISDEAWCLFVNAGEWNSGAWQSTIDTYLANRAAQGFTGVEISFASWVGANTAFAFTDGRDWSGTWPFSSTNNPSSGLNNTYWARMDHLITQAASLGMWVILNATTPMLEGAANGGDSMPNHWNTQQWIDYGTALGNRYGSGYPNLMWIVGDDYFGDFDTQLTLWLNALRATGDTHLVSIQNTQWSSSRTDFTSVASPPIWGPAHAQYDWIYTYDVTYDGVEKSYYYDSSANIPIVWGDGFFLNTGVSGGQTDVRLLRQMMWWALSSGSRGFNCGDNNIWPWDSGSAAAVTNQAMWNSTVPAIATAYSALTNWHMLLPDYSNQFITAGRGTRVPAAVTTNESGTVYGLNTDTYVSGSITADGSLAVLYMSKGSTVTINKNKLKTGYTAKWLDPLTGTTSTATPTPVDSTHESYNSTAKGNNSTEDPDWVLVFQGPPPPVTLSTRHKGRRASITRANLW